jgi:hypothetical protein
MRTLQAQRLKKRTAFEHKHRQDILEQIWEEAIEETKKLAGLLTGHRESYLRETFKQGFEEYREDDKDVYFEEGFIEF